MTFAVVFPGQGTQRVGMCNWLLAAHEELAPVADALSREAGVDMVHLCAKGPLEQLSETQYTQPAMFLLGVASYWHVQSLGLQPAVVAGHSVGEIAALWAAGSLRLDDAMRLVVRRGKLMASAPGDGSMAVIQGLDHAAVASACDAGRSFGRVEIAVRNGVDDWVVSGDRPAVGAAAEAAAAQGARRVTELRGSHAFHSPLMAAVVDEWAAAVEACSIQDAAVPVVLNGDGMPTRSAAEISVELVRQLASPVRWWETMRHFQSAGVDLVVECGTGHFLANLARRAGLPAISCEEPRRLEARLRAAQSAAGATAAAHT